MMQTQQLPIQTDSRNICVVAIGMAGSGKTTFVTKLVEVYTASQYSVFPINLDPAVKTIAYSPIVDIRTTHEYRKIMKDYQLGPNGAILTALNLFTAQPENVVSKMEDVMLNGKKNVFIVDVPGQIEAFTWSASSLILTKSIALLMPVVLAYIVDTHRCQNPNSYLSNLLFAQSIQCRIDYPMILCLNKVDIQDGSNCQEWTEDYNAFTKALNEEENYLATLSKSVVLYMSDFFQKFRIVRISSLTGYGFDKFAEALSDKSRQFLIEAQKNNKRAIEEAEKGLQKNLENLKIKPTPKDK